MPTNSYALPADAGIREIDEIWRQIRARLEAHAKKVDEQVTFACELVWCRPPTETELKDLSAYARAHGLANLARVLFNTNEFLFID